MKKILTLFAGLLLFGTTVFAQPAPTASDTVYHADPVAVAGTHDAAPADRSVIQGPDGTVRVTDHFERRDTGSIFSLFFEGGYTWMGTITLLLIGLLLAAWKRPECVGKLGALALIVGILSTVVGIFGVSYVLQANDVSAGIVWAGIRVALIAPIYGFLVCILSLVIRLLQKPRLL